jgi:carbon storage regulator
MLVLTRKIGESITIASGIRVSVVALEGKHVRLGIGAPESVAIVRSELLEGSPLSPRCEGRRMGRRRPSRAALVNGYANAFPGPKRKRGHPSLALRAGNELVTSA